MGFTFIVRHLLSVIVQAVLGCGDYSGEDKYSGKCNW